MAIERNGKDHRQSAQYRLTSGPESPLYDQLQCQVAAPESCESTPLMADGFRSPPEESLDDNYGNGCDSLLPSFLQKRSNGKMLAYVLIVFFAVGTFTSIVYNLADDLSSDNNHR